MAFDNVLYLPGWIRRLRKNACKRFSITITSGINALHKVLSNKYNVRLFLSLIKIPFQKVTSYVPLRAYVYREGFVRFSNTRFTTERIEDSYVHLTNVAIQKKAPDYNPDRGAKWPLTSLRRFLNQSRGRKPGAIFLQF